ncbi:MAG TPA: sigma-70 family RNA polymerase sigma factor, partial [Planctomycetota bacterium]|nr:sigma-70 family RNA polymerase sigma factor [Planctomycetota bacterium]
MDPSTRSFTADELLAESRWLQALARSLVKEPDAAEDIVQETWLAALRRRPAVRESLRPWLARVLRNQAALLRRNRLHGARDQAELVDEPLPSAADLVVRAETHRMLVGAIIELEEPYRSTVLLRYYDGLSSAEIARRRRVPGPTVRTQLRRGLERLREKLDQEHGGDRQRWVLALVPAASATANVGSLGGAEAAVDAGAAPLAGVPAAAITAVAVAAAVGALLLLRPRSEPRAAAPPPQEHVAAAVSGDLSFPVVRAAVEPAAPAEQASAAPVLGPLSAIVVDEQTLEPLPHFEVELAVASPEVEPAPPSAGIEPDPDVATVRARTDGRGRFTTAESLPAATYEVRLIDDPRVRDQDAIVHDQERVRAIVPQASVRLDPALEDARIATPAGPTYPLHVALPRSLELSDLRAHLRSPRQFRTLYWELHLAPVRRFPADRLPWVRFGHLYTKYLDSEPPWLLEVSSADGLWAGSAEVRSITGVHAPIDLDLRRKGIVAGTVRDELGPVASELVVILRHSDGMGEERRDSPDDRGAYSLAWVEPGAYRLAFESHRHLTERRDVRVVA